MVTIILGFMYPDARKIHLLEQVLKVTNEATLIELERILDKKEVTKKKLAIHDFLGTFTNEEAAGRRKAINESHPPLLNSRS